MQLPTIWWEHIHGFNLSFQDAIQSRHFYVFLWYLVSVAFFYLLGVKLFKNPWFALVGACLYIIHPRILADANYNVKDSLCMALFTISLYYGICVIQRQTILNTILFLFFSALCTTTRVVGGEVIAACLFVLFIKSIREKKQKKFFITFFCISFFFIGIFIVMTPQAWSDPLHVILRIVKTFSNYTTWVGDVKYFGVSIDGHALPWHYLFTWIFITTPLIYQVLWLGGLVAFVYDCIRKIQRKNLLSLSLERLFLFLLLIIPFAYVLILNPTLYNGWRHFYFIYPCLALWAALGLQTLFSLNNSRLRLGGLSLLAVSMAYSSFWILKNHPYEYAYFQPLIRNYAQKNFDLDYWALTEREMYEYISNTDERKDIQVHSYSGHADLFSTQQTTFYNSKSLESANYAMTQGEEFNLSFLYDKVHAIEADGIVLRDLWKKRYDILECFEMRIDASGGMQYEVCGMRWSQKRDSSNIIYTGMLETPLPADTLALCFPSSEILDEIAVYYTEDGFSWQPWSDKVSFTQAASCLSVRCESDTVLGIRLVFPAQNQAAASSFLLYFAGDYIRNDKAYRRGNLAVLGAESNDTEGNQAPFYATDKDNQTRWESGTQREGMYLLLTLDDSYILNGVSLDFGDNPWDYPRNLQIAVSQDKENWTFVEQLATEDHMTYSFDEIAARYIRFELGDTEGTGAHWSVYEASLFSPFK